VRSKDVDEDEDAAVDLGLDGRTHEGGARVSAVTAEHIATIDMVAFVEVDVRVRCDGREAWSASLRRRLDLGDGRKKK
jgi:hypothetical protein